MDVPPQYEVLDTERLARRLGYAQPTVWTHLSRERYDKIPPPSRRLKVGPLWYVGDVEAWEKHKK